MSNIKLSLKAAAVDLIAEMKLKLEELQAKRNATIQQCRDLMESHSITPAMLFPELATTVEMQGNTNEGTGKKRGRPAGSKNKQAPTTETPPASTETAPEGTNDEGQAVDPPTAIDATAEAQPALV